MGTILHIVAAMHWRMKANFSLLTPASSITCIKSGKVNNYTSTVQHIQFCMLTALRLLPTIKTKACSLKKTNKLITAAMVHTLWQKRQLMNDHSCTKQPEIKLCPYMRGEAVEQVNDLASPPLLPDFCRWCNIYLLWEIHWAHKVTSTTVYRSKCKYVVCMV